MKVRHQLAAMVGEDDRVRSELAAAGELFDGYHPRMQEVHDRNAEALEAILDAQGWDAQGWPSGREAWIIAQHAIAKPAFQRRVLQLLRETAAVPPADIAMLEDRIRFFEGRPQVYGTQFDWDENGEMSPALIEDPSGVDARRASVGLPPIAQRNAEIRAQMGNEKPPRSFAERRQEFEDWARRTGWRTGV
jgi:hypothetical protein